MKSILKVKKAVIPVAGKGTRFLPATKSIPKEMIPLIDRPMIHYVIDEVIQSGLETVIFVTSGGKESIENYFDRNITLETFLQENGKEDSLRLVKEIGKNIEIISVRQKEQLGLGHAVLCAEKAIGNEPFAVLLGDDLVIGSNPATKQLIEIFESKSADGVIGVMEVPIEETRRYGIVDGKFEGDHKTLLMSKMIEKPKPEDAPTNLATPGRYVFNPKIFDYLKKIERGVGGEYQLTDAINQMAKENSVYAHKFIGDRFDTGNVESYLEAMVEFAMRNSNYRATMEKIIANQYQRMKGQK